MAKDINPQTLHSGVLRTVSIHDRIASILGHPFTVTVLPHILITRSLYKLETLTSFSFPAVIARESLSPL